MEIVAVSVLLFSILSTWYFTIVGNRWGKRISTISMLFVFVGVVGYWYGQNAAIFMLFGFAFIPLAVPFIYYPVALFFLRNAEAQFGRSGVELRFDIFAGYKSILS